MTKDNGEIVRELTCKIRRIDDSTFATLSGTTQGTTLGINLLHEAVKYGRLIRASSMLQQTESIADYLRRKLIPGMFVNEELPHKEPHIAVLILFGRRNDTLQMVAIDFVWGSLMSREITLQPTYRKSFTTSFPIRYYIADPVIWNFAKSDSVKHLPVGEQVQAITNAALMNTTTSGPPIDIVCVTKYSYRWIQRKPECEE